jgi:hypothetical protein
LTGQGGADAVQAMRSPNVDAQGGSNPDPPLKNN